MEMDDDSNNVQPNAVGRIAQVVLFAKELLTKKGMTAPDKSMSGREIFEEYKKDINENNDDEIPRNTFIQCLSRASHMPGTDILCKGRRQGFYSTSEHVDSDNEPTAESESFSKSEESLYPYFRDWLLSKGYKARILADRKKNKKWGNPDILGVRFTNILGRVEEEIVSIECKKSLSGWQQYIFEAVAHKRFFERSYFAFAYPEDEAQKLLPEMMSFAEYYGIGILLLELPKQQYDSLQSGTDVSLEDIEVQEIYPAAFRKPITALKARFLRELPATTDMELLEFMSVEE